MHILKLECLGLTVKRLWYEANSGSLGTFGSRIILLFELLVLTLFKEIPVAKVALFVGEYDATLVACAASAY